MLIACSHCQANLDIPSDFYGRVVQCPVCNRKLKIDAPAEKLPTIEGKPVRRGWQDSDHAKVNPLHAFLIGFVVSAVWLGCMYYIPPIRFSIGAIFVDRGWAGFVEAWLFFWGVAILYLKYLKIKYQERAALLNLFPSNIGEVVDSSTVGAFIDYIYKMPASMRRSIFVNRIRKALEIFEARNSKSEAEVLLNSLSAVDANRSAGSFARVKVFLWAIPILGFVATVQALTEMASSMSFDATDPASIQAEFSNLTAGLRIVFDPPLLGVILSMFLSFLLALVQKQDKAALTMIDTICSEKLLPKLEKKAASPQ
ncbi:MAG: hypothetical protein ACKOLA_13120 [Spartobacteria bacterium]